MHILQRVTWLLLAASWLVLGTGCGDDDHGQDHGGPDAGQRDAAVVSDGGSRSDGDTVADASSGAGNIDASAGDAGENWADAGSDAAVAASFVLAGRWASDGGSVEDIGRHVGDPWNDNWVQTTIVYFDNAARMAIRQNSADDADNPSKYSRVVWTDFDYQGGFWYCSVDIGLDTAEEARESTRVADDSDPANGGCGEWPWTYLVPDLPDAGT